MQLTSATGSMVVDYYPIEDSGNFIYKVVKFQGVDTMSTKCITKSDFDRECEERIGLGYEVTNFNTESVKVNPMNGAV
jgi:hypothetical protein